MYYITKDNPDGSKEKVAETTGTKEQAFEEFEKVIRAIVEKNPGVAFYDFFRTFIKFCLYKIHVICKD